MSITVEIHKAKEIVQLLNELAQIIISIPTQKDMLSKIDAVKRILEEDAIIKEEK